MPVIIDYIYMAVFTPQLTSQCRQCHLWHDLDNTIAASRRRFVGHILRLPATRPASASLALEWTPQDGRRRTGGPMRTWQNTLKEDLEEMGVEWSNVRATASDCTIWRQLVTQCSPWNQKN